MKLVADAHAEFVRAMIPALPRFEIFTPGRINLIGEHTDYNGGKVMPFAVDLGIRANIGIAPIGDLFSGVRTGRGPWFAVGTDFSKDIFVASIADLQDFMEYSDPLCTLDARAILDEELKNSTRHQNLWVNFGVGRSPSA